MKGALLLIDIENTIGANAAAGTARARLHALLSSAAGAEEVVAACARSRIRQETADVLRERGVRLHLVDDGKGAADRALLECALAASKTGTQRFTVASADAGFAVLGQLGTLHVLAWEGQPIGKRLTRAASGVQRLARVQREAVPPQRQPAPQASSAQEPAPAPVSASAPPTHEPQALHGTALRGTALRWAVAGGLALVGSGFCAGAAFGAGMALGHRLLSRAAHRTPP